MAYLKGRLRAREAARSPELVARVIDDVRSTGRRNSDPLDPALADTLLASSTLTSAASASGPASAQAFAKWARAHPERWDDEFYDGLVSAFAESDPCDPA